MAGPAHENKKSAKSQKTRERIIDCFLDMIPIKKWDKISVKELCEKAEITRGTFYQYFNDIYDLMEQIETPMFEDLNRRFNKIKQMPRSPLPVELFPEKFDYTPPETLKQWFLFCKKYHKPMSAMLDRKNGDTYFVKRMKVILAEYINHMMDQDGMPHDALREHFLKVFLELHFLAASTWLTTEDAEFLSIKEILNLLNTMRVGANYLAYQRMVSPDFDIRMAINDEEEEP